MPKMSAEMWDLTTFTKADCRAYVRIWYNFVGLKNYLQTLQECDFRAWKQTWSGLDTCEHRMACAYLLLLKSALGGRENGKVYEAAYYLGCRIGGNRDSIGTMVRNTS